MFKEEYKGFHLYFASGNTKDCVAYLKKRKCLKLASWYNERTKILDWISDGSDIFVDSGAFSAHTKGVQPDINAYIQFLNEHDERIIMAAELDKIPGVYRRPKTKEQLLEAPEISWKNYLYMRDKVKNWKKILPVYHQGEDNKHLKRMLETTFDGEHIPYIGISPANDVFTTEKEKWLDKVFDIIKHSSNPNVKTHGFGITSLTVLNRQPLYSSDSTRWVLAAAYGHILTPIGELVVSKTSNFKKECFDYYPEEFKQQVIKMVEARGFKMEDLQSDAISRDLWNIDFMKNWADNYKYTPKAFYQHKLF